MWIHVTVIVVVLAIGYQLMILNQVQYRDGVAQLPCNIERVEHLTCSRFVDEFLGMKPVVFTINGESEQSERFRTATERDELISAYGDKQVKVSTANSYTGKVWTTITLKTYLDASTHQDRSKSGNETWYLFGGLDGEWADQLMASYVGPNLPSETLLRREGSNKATLCDRFEKWNPDGTPPRTDDFVTTSFGIAGENTGVPFHFHGPGFLQVLHGRKRWFLYPPGEHVPFHPNATSIEWVETEYQKEIAKPNTLLKECVLNENEFIYFPDMWMHATLNLDPYTVFVASFA